MSTVEDVLRAGVLKRKTMRQKATNYCNKMGSFSTLGVEKRFILKKTLENIRDELISLDDKILSCRIEMKETDQALEEEFELCSDYLDKIRHATCDLERLEELSFKTPQKQMIPDPTLKFDSARSFLKSPTAPLPSFKSEPGENLEIFISSFEETLSKFNYTEYDKLLLLKQQVEGKGAYLLESLEPAKQTYSAAKELLTSAFASKEVQVFNVIKQMSEMNMPYNFEPFKYISAMRKIQQSVERLNITIDDVMRFFFFNGMNESFKTQVIAETHNVRPHLKELFESFFDANERYLAAQNKYKKEKSHSYKEKNSTTMALAVENNSKPKLNSSFANCILCQKEGESNHSINKCEKYSTAQEKINKLKALNACIKCGYSNHTTRDCKFRFKNPCRDCGEWHFSFLCLKSGIEPPAQKQNGKNKSTHGSIAITTNSYRGSSSDDSVLSTFSCLSDDVKLRGLRDTGSQSNLISMSALNKLKYEIIDDNIILTINGINSAKTYKSKLVLIKLKLGSEIREIEALSIPEINLSLKLPELSKLIKVFIDKGYTLADDYLVTGDDKIDNIDIILGANASNCFNYRTVQFGSSVYLSTQLGIMLFGNLPEMIKNIPLLSNCVDVNNTKNCKSVLINPNHSSSTVLVSNVFESNGELISGDIMVSDGINKLNEELLTDYCNKHLQKSDYISDNQNSEQDNELVEYLLDNCIRKSNGRIQMPLLWNSKVQHLLGGNFNLAKKILLSAKKKLLKSPENLSLMNDSIKELIKIGAIEKIHNLEEYMIENPSYSFLAHMPIIKTSRESTKCRIVFLSNLTDKAKSGAISHNQAMLSGPCLNQKLSVSLIHLRFDKYLLCFDLVKAFLQVELPTWDQCRLLFLWFRDPINGDFSIEGYKNVRLSFGLRCSPTILMVTLYKILIIDAANDDERLKKLKSLIYSLTYMDNAAVTSNDKLELEWAYNKLSSIFNQYQFYLQQFCTNEKNLQNKLPESEKCSPVQSELFGLIWNKEDDTLHTRKKNLDIKANTKRSILKTIAENFDPYNFDGPILNRARLFLHCLQLQKNLGWDTQISGEDSREWVNIGNQVNMACPMIIPRFVGSRTDTYDLIAFCDSSKLLYGAVVYIRSKSTGQVNFILAKNRMVNEKLEGKSIPKLELLANELAAEILTDLHHELSGPLCLTPIKIDELYVYSDSLVALSWINSYFNNLDKLNKLSVFVKNKLKLLAKYADINSLIFSFVDGISNPSDFITRAVSYKLLIKTNYLTGPTFLTSTDVNRSDPDIFTFTIPRSENVITLSAVIDKNNLSDVPLIDCSRFSNLQTFINTYRKLYEFIYKLTNGVNSKFDYNADDMDSKILQLIIIYEQSLHFTDILSYFRDGSVGSKNVPNLISQLNLFVDCNGMLRVGSKMLKKDEFKSNAHCPVLLPKSSHLTLLIVRNVHEKLKHCGIYSILSDLRRNYWIPHYYSVCKKILNDCVHCKRFSQRTIKLNQSPYREFRMNPSQIPFSNVFIDHIGPFSTKDVDSNNTKSYLLIITCLYTRAVNLIVAADLSTTEFLHCFQKHIFAYGTPQHVYSDLGSQIVAGSNIILNFLNDSHTHKFFKDNGVRIPKFEQYFKGNPALGSLVESLVKQTKLLVHGSIKNNILKFREFEFVIAETVSLINRRPICFKECLRGQVGESIPEAITPEVLLHGFNLPSINVVPHLQSEPNEPDWKPSDDSVDKLRSTYLKLRKVRSNLIEKYNGEFISNLIHQAVNVKDKYCKVSHKALNIGDIVLLKEQHAKPSQYPMAIVKSIVTNDMGETTGAMLFKGATKEIVKRHANCIIPLLTFNGGDIEPNDVNSNLSVDDGKSDSRKVIRKKRRKAFNEGLKKLRELSP